MVLRGEQQNTTGEAHDRRQAPRGSQNHTSTWQAGVQNTMTQAGSGAEKAGREKG